MYDLCMTNYYFEIPSSHINDMQDFTRALRKIQQRNANHPSNHSFTVPELAYELRNTTSIMIESNGEMQPCTIRYSTNADNEPSGTIVAWQDSQIHGDYGVCNICVESHLKAYTGTIDEIIQDFNNHHPGANMKMYYYSYTPEGNTFITNDKDRKYCTAKYYVRCRIPALKILDNLSETVNGEFTGIYHSDEELIMAMIRLMYCTKLIWMKDPSQFLYRTDLDMVKVASSLSAYLIDESHEIMRKPLNSIIREYTNIIDVIIKSMKPENFDDNDYDPDNDFSDAFFTIDEFKFVETDKENEYA